MANIENPLSHVSTPRPFDGNFDPPKTSSIQDARYRPQDPPQEGHQHHSLIGSNRYGGSLQSANRSGLTASRAYGRRWRRRSEI